MVTVMSVALGAFFIHRRVSRCNVIVRVGTKARHRSQTEYVQAHYYGYNPHDFEFFAKLSFLSCNLVAKRCQRGQKELLKVTVS